MREGRIGLARCQKTHQLFGVRFEKKNGTWCYNWSFKLNPVKSSKEDYSESVIEGLLVMEDDYPGCPYCQDRRFIICNCGKLNCGNIEGESLVCEWCHEKVQLAGEYDGKGLKLDSDV